MRYISETISSVVKFISRFRIEIFVLILMIPAIVDVFKPGFMPMHDDLQVLRLVEVHKCVLDLQIPCRWVPDAGFGYGYPLMEFYPPMPYYPMELMVLLGFGFFFPVKVMFALAFVLSGLGMYLLAKEFFGKWGGMLAAVLYVYSPYHSVDVYVRGAMNEAWGMVWFPFVLLYIYRLITRHSRPDRESIQVNSKITTPSLRGGSPEFTRRGGWQSRLSKIKFQVNSDFIYLSISLALQLTSHNVMTLVFAPTAIVWAIFWMWKAGKFESIKELFLAGALGLGLSAFFFVPVVLEQKFVHVDSMTSGYFNYLAHFADIKQLFFSRFWGYGGSTWGPEDGMSFSIGHAQWIFATLAGAVALMRLYRIKFYKKSSLIVSNQTHTASLNYAILITIAFGFFYAFLTHSRSNFIWERLSVLQFAQFPWRLVALIVFYFSFAGGYLATVTLPKIFKVISLPLIILGIILFNLSFFRFERHVRVTFQEKLSGLQWENQVTGGIFDYLPRTASRPPGDPAFTIPKYIEGQGSILNYRTGSNWVEFDAYVSTDSAKVMIPMFTFQGLKTKVDSKRVITEMDPDLGRIIVNLDKGIHHVEAKIGYTKVRLISDFLTLLSIVILVKLISHDRKRSS